MSQHYENHIRFSIPYHFIAIPLTLICCFIALYRFIILFSWNTGLVALAFLLIGLAMGFARLFSLKAQDRAIRAEESLRYYILAGRIFPNELKMSEIIALRFASDEELVGLVDRVIKENLSTKEIKMSIKNWRGDYHRI